VLLQCRLGLVCLASRTSTWLKLYWAAREGAKSCSFHSP
jgi:hypothetical protein